jgi:hypothetical protein
MTNPGFVAQAFPAGTHVRCIHADDGERRKIVSTFVESALPEQEWLSYFADALSAEDLPARLARLCSGATPYDILSAPPYMVVRRQIVHNPHYPVQA